MVDIFDKIWCRWSHYDIDIDIKRGHRCGSHYDLQVNWKKYQEFHLITQIQPQPGKLFCVAPLKFLHHIYVIMSKVGRSEIVCYCLGQLLSETRFTNPYNKGVLQNLKVFLEAKWFFEQNIKLYWWLEWNFCSSEDQEGRPIYQLP